jgi:hypothetical protein
MTLMAKKVIVIEKQSAEVHLMPESGHRHLQLRPVTPFGMFRSVLSAVRKYHGNLASVFINGCGSSLAEVMEYIHQIASSSLRG